LWNSYLPLVASERGERPGGAISAGFLPALSAEGEAEWTSTPDRRGATVQPFDVTKAQTSYETLSEQLKALLAGEPDFLANAANMASLVFHALADVNWVGFYFLRDRELVLGPFQGKPACTRIALGKGVCGTAAAREATVVVPDVHAFPGHIACDCQSNSEIVVPLVSAGRLLGVLDIDSPSPGRFDQRDRDGLEWLVRVFLETAGA
jgi:GAF domain-containing protein